MPDPLGQIPAVIVEAPKPAPSEIYETFEPVQWEQNREEVWHAMVVHRWAVLKLRQLAREQYAIDWATMPGTQLWKWARRVGLRIFRFLPWFWFW